MIDFNKVSFEQSGTSSNITFYRPVGGRREDGLFAEVCSNDFTKVEGRLVRRRPSNYRVTVQWWPGGKRQRKEINFLYEPKQTARGGRLSGATVTRIVREQVSS
jgi:hypothetical protein